MDRTLSWTNISSCPIGECEYPGSELMISPLATYFLSSFSASTSASYS